MSEYEVPGELPGTPDGFERLWTPHRMVYIGGENKPTSTDAGDCPFCPIQAGEDRAGLIVHRGELAYAVLNLYPYSPGHLLICPYRHVADYTDLSAEETAEVAALTQQAMRAIRRGQRTSRLQPRDEPGRGRRRRYRRPPPPARRARGGPGTPTSSR